MNEGKFNFLRNAQRTESMHITLPREVVINDFSGGFASFGSCFAQNIQTVMEPYGMRFWFNRDVCAHYSAESVANLLERISEKKPHSPDEIYAYQDPLGGVVPYQYFYKRRVYGPDAAERTLKRLDALDEECRREVRDCRHLLITLGTSHVVRLKKTDVLIACATGIPSSEFYYDLCEVDETVGRLETILESLRRIRGGTLPNVFFTISPQRYNFSDAALGEDSVLANCLSKSILRVAVSRVVKRYRDESVFYFPAFELVIDELRVFESLSHYDYLHIDQIFTPKYVVKRFLTAYASDSVLRQLELVDDGILLLQALRNAMSEHLSKDDSEFLRRVDSFIARAREIVGNSDWSPRLAELIHRMLVVQERGELHEDVTYRRVANLDHLRGKRVAVWGASGNFLEKWLPLLDMLKRDTQVALLVDGDQRKWGTSVGGFEVRPPEALKDADVDCVIIASTFKDEISLRIGDLRSGLPIVK